MFHSKKTIEEIEKKIGFRFENPSLLSLAFVHRSFYNENRNLVYSHNERLEFLGDSVLGLVVAEYLYLSYPEETEGVLSSWKAYLVNASSCKFYLEELGLQKFILLGKGEKQTFSRGRASIYADVFEAVIGGVYVDSDFAKAKNFLYRHYEELWKKMLKAGQKNYKEILQNFSQRKYHKHPQYEVINVQGPDHQKEFAVSVFLNKEKLGTGKGSSKKEAEQLAAKNAVEYLEKKGLL